jgi:hypothetical protein
MSGSVEENSVEQQSVTSPLRRIARLTAPQRDAYATPAAEIGALALLNQQGGPQMLGFLAGLQSDRTQATDAYRDDLTAINAQQSALARLAGETERRSQDVNLIRTAMQTPDAASAFSMVRPLLTPDGANTLQRFTDTRLGLRESEAAENRAQAARAASGGGGTGDSPDPLIAMSREQRIVDAAVRNDPDVMRLTREAAAARAALTRFDPLIVNSVPSMRQQFDAAQAAANQASQALLEAQQRVREAAVSRLPGRTQAAPAPVATPQSVARTDEASPPRATSAPTDRIARARANGWTDQQLQQQLQREGMSPAQIQELLRQR